MKTNKKNKSKIKQKINIFQLFCSELWGFSLRKILNITSFQEIPQITPPPNKKTLYLAYIMEQFPPIKERTLYRSSNTTIL